MALISCSNGVSPLPFTIGGTVTGMLATGLVLQNNAQDDLDVPANGDFTFSTSVEDGSAYSVTVKTTPAGETCAVLNGAGTVNGGSVNNIVVSCSEGGNVDLEMINASGEEMKAGELLYTASSIPIGDAVPGGSVTIAPDGQTSSNTDGGWLYMLTSVVSPISWVYSAKFGSSGTGNGEFNRPVGIAMDASGDIYVADGENNRIQKFTSAGVYISQFGSTGTGDGQFDNPMNIAIDSSGNIYVTDLDNDRIQKFNSEGVYQMQFGTSGSGDGQFDGPWGIAIDNNNIYVTDGGNDRVQRFTLDGTYSTKFGSHGSGDGQFDGPNGITVGDAGIYVSDDKNCRVQRFNSAGVYELQFGSEGSGDGQFNTPAGILIDGSGSLYVADVQNNRIQKFTSDGVYESKFGSAGSGDGQFNMPAIMVFDRSGNMYITEYGNNRVQKMSPEQEVTAYSDSSTTMAVAQGSVAANASGGFDADLSELNDSGLSALINSDSSIMNTAFPIGSWELRLTLDDELPSTLATASYPAMGVLLTSTVAPRDSGDIRLSGQANVMLEDGIGVATGRRLYLSETTAGRVSTTGTAVIGYALEAAEAGTDVTVLAYLTIAP